MGTLLLYSPPRRSLKSAGLRKEQPAVFLFLTLAKQALKDCPAKTLLVFPSRVLIKKDPRSFLRDLPYPIVWVLFLYDASVLLVFSTYLHSSCGNLLKCQGITKGSLKKGHPFKKEQTTHVFTLDYLMWRFKKDLASFNLNSNVCILKFLLDSLVFRTLIRCL